MNIGSLYRNLT